MTCIKISAILIGIVITILSLLPPSSGVEVHVNDKVGHFLAYGVWMINLGLLFNKNHYWKIIVSILVFSCMMEFFQSFIPGREVSIYDLLANTIGALIGTVILLLTKAQIIKLLEKLKIVTLSN